MFKYMERYLTIYEYWLTPISEPQVGGCDSGEHLAFLRACKQANLVEGEH